MKRKLVVAQIVKPQGIKGEVKLKSLISDPSDLLDIKKVFIEETSEKPVDIKKAWRYKDNIFIALEGFETRNDAETLRGKNLYIDSDDAEKPEDGTYYIADLIGCEVNGSDGEKFGLLKDILQHGAADVYVVQGNRNFMMPALKRVIINTDIGKKKITVDSKTLAEVAVYED